LGLGFGFFLIVIHIFFSSPEHQRLHTSCCKQF
jgi:hypothetical protein